MPRLGFITVGDRTGNANDVINDRIDTVTKGFLAMTVACARCHDHKFDPIPTKDYYALHGIFNSIVEPKDEPVIAQAANKQDAIKFKKEMAKLEQENRDFYYATASGKNAEFRQKASAYLLAAYYAVGNGKKGGLAAELKKSLDLKSALDLPTMQRVAQAGDSEEIPHLRRSGT